MASMVTKNVFYIPNKYYKNMIKNRFSILLGIKKLDKRDIVRMTGLDRHTIANLYNDKTKGIDFATLDKLCFALECTPNDIFKYIPDDLPDKHLYE